LALFQPRERSRPFGKTTALLLHQSGDPSSDAITIEYNGIVSDRRYTQSVRAGFGLFLKQSGLFEHGSQIHIALATHEVIEGVPNAGLILTELNRMPSWLVDLNAVRESRKQYLDLLSANTRYQVRRSLRLYQKQGPVEATVARSSDEALSFLDELKSLHQKTWNSRGLPGSFASPHFEKFHRALIRRCTKRGTVEIVRITAGSQLIAQVYNFIRKGYIYAYQTGLSYETDPKLKPGMIAHWINIDRHLTAGASAYDFLGGNARYKSNLGMRGPDLAHYMIEPKNPVSMGYALARRLKSRILDK
jgi:CelD/BcsL family acetyltransferase involved in cellulose biosynthesis